MKTSSQSEQSKDVVKIPSRRWTLSVNAIRIVMAVIVIADFVFVRLNPDAILFPIVALILLIIGVPFLVIDVVRVTKANAYLKRELTKISINRDRLLGSVKSLDASTRQEVAIWLHGTVQGDLLLMVRRQAAGHAQLVTTIESMAKKFPGLRKEILDFGISVQQAAQQSSIELQQFSDEVVRAKSHSFYPPLLATSLQFALEDLLRDRAVLKLDRNLAVIEDDLVGPTTTSEPKTTLDFVSHLAERVGQRRFLSPDTRYRVYRVVEEAVSNALKKNAEEISVSVGVVDDDVVIRVIDNGSPVPSDYGMSFGLTVIDSLSTAHGGSWSLTNTDDGVVLEARVPFQQVDDIYERARREQIEEMGVR